jgi:hypothetical protein
MADNEEMTAQEMRDIIDMYMPTIITGIDHTAWKVREARERDEWDVDDVAVLAAYSYAHNMLKRLGVPQKSEGHGEADYDLPSVLDLMKSLKKKSAAIDATLAKYPETKDTLGRVAGRLF